MNPSMAEIAEPVKEDSTDPTAARSAGEKMDVDGEERPTVESDDSSSSSSSGADPEAERAPSIGPGQKLEDLPADAIGDQDETEDMDQELEIPPEEDDGGETIMSDPENGPQQEGKRVKVYELRDSSWFDRGTGYCKGIYDDTQDLAMLIVESEESGEKPENEGEGGFLKEDLLLTSRVEKEDIYVRQQDTLIVWTEPTSNLDIALSFQDAEGCEDIWLFIGEVQRHLNNLPTDNPPPSSSSPLSGSPTMNMAGGSSSGPETRTAWEAPTLSNIKQQENWLRMQAKSAQGRERAVEHIVGEDYIKHLVAVFEQAEDLESLSDLHVLCNLMQTILMFNDNTLLEYILQDDVFMGVIGIFEYDPEFPSLKASYREFFRDVAKFRQVVEIKDLAIRTKIHQLFRVQYLRDVVLARMLDDGTFGILNGFVFFTQVDIINHIQSNEAFLTELLSGFKDDRPGTPDPNNIAPLDERRRDIILLLNQLMILGKGVQLPSRLALYRNLLDRGLLFAVEWALRRPEAQILHAGAEILTLVVDLDVSAVRMHVLKEDEMKRRTLIQEMIRLLKETRNLGLLSQVGESLRNLLETSTEENSFLQRKEGPISENFIVSFYENCVIQVYSPLTDLPAITRDTPLPQLPRERIALLHLLIEILSASILNPSQHQRAAYYILSNPISKKIVSLLYMNDKPLRHAVLRFVRSCLKLQNHFVNRYMIKNDLLAPLIDTLEAESSRDNMLSSACMEVLDIIRKENIKPIINHLFESSRPRIEALSSRPQLRQLIFGLTVRWQQNNEPPPPPVQPETPDTRKPYSMAVESQQDDYFNGSDEEEETVEVKVPGEAENASPQKRKRTPVSASSPDGQPPRRPGGPSPSKMLRRKNESIPQRESPRRIQVPGRRKRDKPVASTGLVAYDDEGSDSEGSVGSQSPISRSSTMGDLTASPEDAGTGDSASVELDTEKEKERLEEDLGDVGLMMRAKRLREQEEEDSFVALKPKRAAAEVGEGGEKGEEKGEQGQMEGEKKDEAKKGEKKIRLSFGPLKKLSGMGGK